MYLRSPTRAPGAGVDHLAAALIAATDVAPGRADGAPTESDGAATPVDAASVATSPDGSTSLRRSDVLDRSIGSPRSDVPDGSASRRRPGVPGRSSGPRRSDALDRLRGVALVAMLVHHLVDWSTGDARAVLPGWRSFSLTDAAAVAFFVAAGASMALFVSSRLGRGTGRLRVAGMVARRYGMLVPVGLTLDWVLWRDPRMFGVLEALGVTVVAGAAVAAIVSRRLLPAVALWTLALGILSERAVEGEESWLASEAIGGKFPFVTYLGFVLVGVVAVRTGWYADRRRVAAAAALGVVATLGMLVDGIVPARYPGDVHFVVPGLALTAIAFALCQYRWPALLGGFDQVLRRAAAHTLGIFLAHYLIYGALRRFGLMGEIEPVVAVPVALAATAALCLVAPHVPRLPWSLRTGRRRSPAAARPSVVAWPKSEDAPSASSPNPSSSAPATGV